MGSACGRRLRPGATVRPERRTARTLCLLRSFGWRVLHAVHAGGRVLVHHQLGDDLGDPALHHYRGLNCHAAVLVDGRATRYGQASQYEGERAARLLTSAAGQPVIVASIVVIVGARSVRNGETAGIRVLTRVELPVWLLVRSRVFDRHRRDEIYELARRSST